MNILTGAMFCILAISFICVKGTNSSNKVFEIYADICAISLVCMILLVGFWITVFLGRL